MKKINIHIVYVNFLTMLIVCRSRIPLIQDRALCRICFATEEIHILDVAYNRRLKFHDDKYEYLLIYIHSFVWFCFPRRRFNMIFIFSWPIRMYESSDTELAIISAPRQRYITYYSNRSSHNSQNNNVACSGQSKYFLSGRKSYFTWYCLLIHCRAISSASDARIAESKQSKRLIFERRCTSEISDFVSRSRDTPMDNLSDSLSFKINQISSSFLSYCINESSKGGPVSNMRHSLYNRKIIF